MLHQIAAKRDLFQLINEYCDNPYCLELLHFFSQHPDASVSGLAVVHALSVSGEKRFIERALCRLVDNGVVKTYIENGSVHYCLNLNKASRQKINEMAHLDWSQWQGILRQSYLQS
jgi:hypothetical protein